MFKTFLNGTAHFCMAPEGGGGSAAAAGSGGGSGEGADGKGDAATGGKPGEGGQAGAAAIAWYPDATAEQVTSIQANGFDKSQNPAKDIYKSYEHLRSLNSALNNGSAVVVPGDTADQKTKDAFFNKLGRPDAADKYTAQTFAGLDDDGVKGLRSAMFDAGLTDKQASAMEKWNNDAAKVYETKLAEAGKIEVAQQTAALQKEWGAAYEQNLRVGAEAAKQMGWTTDQINGLQMVLGFDGVMKLAHTIGQKVGEGQFVPGDSGRSGGGAGIMTPEQAKRELNALTNDQNFMKSWSDKAHPGHQDAINKKTQLTKWAFGAK